jgi:hypothetical protein
MRQQALTELRPPQFVSPSANVERVAPFVFGLSFSERDAQLSSM